MIRSILLPVMMLAVSLGVSRHAYGQTDTLIQKNAAIRSYIEKCHVRALTVAYMRQSMAAMQQNDSEPGHSQSAVGLFAAKADSIVGILIDSIVPVYGSYFSLRDIEQLSAMLDSPIMQYSIRVTPAIMKQMQEIGAVLGKRVMTDIMNSLNTEPSAANDPAPLVKKPSTAGRVKKKQKE